MAELKQWMKTDGFIMDDFSSYYQGRSFYSFLRSINRAQLFLKVVTRSDIQLTCRWQCKSMIFTFTLGCLSPSRNYYKWPEESQLSRANLYNWNIAFAEVYGLTPNNHIFNQEFRGQEWLEDSLGFFQWRYDNSCHILYQKDQVLRWQIWRQFQGCTRSETRCYEYSSKYTLNLPQGTNVADITWLSATKCKLISTGSISNNQDQGGDNDK